LSSALQLTNVTPVGLTNHKAPSKHNYDEPKHMKTGGGNLGVGGTFFLQEAFYIY
jgi:hypothetical protein